jgi:alpha-L-rhamnosidase
VVDGIDWASGEYLSPRGRIASSWRRTPEGLVVEVEVPVNAVAELHLPASRAASVRESDRPLADRGDVSVPSRTDDEVVVALGSGRYRFVVQPPSGAR